MLGWNLDIAEICASILMDYTGITKEEALDEFFQICLRTIKEKFVYAR